MCDIDCCAQVRSFNNVIWFVSKKSRIGLINLIYFGQIKDNFINSSQTDLLRCPTLTIVIIKASILTRQMNTLHHTCCILSPKKLWPAAVACWSLLGRLQRFGILQVLQGFWLQFKSFSEVDRWRWAIRPDSRLVLWFIPEVLHGTVKFIQIQGP